MLKEIIEALEKRKQTIELQKLEDQKRREVVAPMLTEISNLLVKVLNKSSNENSTPEEAYVSLRNSVIELHTELMSSVESMQNSDATWAGRSEELRQILNDMKKLQQLSQSVEEESSEPESEPEPEAEKEVKVRARPRSVGQKPVSLRQQRNEGE